MLIKNAKMPIMKSKKGVVHTLVMAGLNAPASWVLCMVHIWGADCQLLNFQLYIAGLVILAKKEE